MLINVHSAIKLKFNLHLFKMESHIARIITLDLQANKEYCCLNKACADCMMYSHKK